jgi:hypothetical protein
MSDNSYVFYKRSTKENPSKLKVGLVTWLYGILNKRIIKTVNKDIFFRKSTDNFYATIQFSTMDDLFNRHIKFNGPEGIEYYKGKAKNPDASIIFDKINDLFTIEKNILTDTSTAYKGIIDHLLEFKGNTNILLKFSYLSIYVNPFIKKAFKKKELKKLYEKE